VNIMDAVETFASVRIIADVAMMEERTVSTLGRCASRRAG